MPSLHPKLDELIALLATLRAPGGCAWDAQQTHESLVRYLIEECFELVEAIETGDREGMIEELGDVLYQVIFHSDIAAQSPSENFTIEDVAARMTAKMISRHPHVFGTAEAKAALDIETADDVVAVWDELKAADKPHRKSLLDGIPNSMPALALAEKLIERGGKIGVGPGETALETDDELEFGNHLLELTAAAKKAGLNPERSLRLALRVFRDQIAVAEAN